MKNQKYQVLIEAISSAVRHLPDEAKIELFEGLLNDIDSVAAVTVIRTEDLHRMCNDPWLAHDDKPSND